MSICWAPASFLLAYHEAVSGQKHEAQWILTWSHTACPADWKGGPEASAGGEEGRKHGLRSCWMKTGVWYATVGTAGFADCPRFSWLPVWPETKTSPLLLTLLFSSPKRENDIDLTYRCCERKPILKKSNGCNALQRVRNCCKNGLNNRVLSLGDAENNAWRWRIGQKS